MAVPRWWFAPAPKSGSHKRGAGTRRQDKNNATHPAAVAALVALDPGWDRTRGLAPPNVLAWCAERLDAIEHPPRRWVRRRSTDVQRRPGEHARRAGDIPACRTRKGQH